MTNITNLMSAEIAERTIEASYARIIKNMEIEEIALAEEVYSALFDKEELKLVNAIPYKWKNMSKRIPLNLTGHSVEIWLKKEKPFPVKVGIYERFILNSITLHNEVQAFVDKKTQTENKKKNEYKILLATIKSAKTLKRLREIWPEGAAFIPPDSAPQRALTIPFSDISKSLGLPLEASS